jgi:protein SDA1
VECRNEFVSEGSASEVAAAGLNAIREICLRQPLAMSETLLGDLIQYQRSKDKGIVMAAKGLQSLYREVHPDLLQKKYRGKTATMGLRSGEIKQMKFGEEEEGGIEGIELLEQYKEEQKRQKRAEQGLEEGEEPENSDDEDGFNSSDWEVDSDVGSVDSGGWIDVSSDSEGEGPAPKRRRTSSGAPELEGEDTENVPVKRGGISKLATTSILTPADLAKLQELKREAKIEKEMGVTSSKKKRELIAKHIEEGLTAEDIELPATLGKKSTKEERVARAREGKPDREEHKSTQAIRKSKKDAEGKSSTNKDKARKKNFFMTLGKARAKNKRSLTEAQKTLRGHISRSKSGGRRRNGG